MMKNMARDDNTRFRITTHAVESQPTFIQADPFAGLLQAAAVFGAKAVGPSGYSDDLVTFWRDDKRRVEVPDELVLGEFLDLNADNDSELVAFLATYGPFRSPIGWTEDARDIGDETYVDDASANPRSPRYTEWNPILGSGHQIFVGALVQSWYGESKVDFARRILGEWVHAYSLEAERVHVKVRQALVESWLQLVPEDLLRERASDQLRAELREPWERRACTSPLAFLEPDDDVDEWKAMMIPPTTGELLRTMVQTLNQSLYEWSARVELDGFGGPEPRIVDALDLQLLAYLDRGVAARICAKEGCGRWFVHQRGRSRAGQQRDLGVKYCSASCARAAAQRAYRRRRAKGSQERRGDGG